MVRFRVLWLNLLVLERFRGVFTFIVLSCLPWFGGARVLGGRTILGAFKEFGSAHLAGSVLSKGVEEFEG